MDTVVDFSKVGDKEQKKKSKGPYLEDGVYEVRTTSNDLRNSQRSGKPMLVVGFEIISGSYKSKKFTIYFMLNVAVWKLKQLNNAVGLGTDEMIDVKVGFEAGSYLDKEMRMEIHITRDQAHRIVCKEVLPLENAPF